MKYTRFIGLLLLSAVSWATDRATIIGKITDKSGKPLKDATICIETDDADGEFLKRLATRSDLGTHLESKLLRSAITVPFDFYPRADNER